MGGVADFVSDAVGLVSGVDFAREAAGGITGSNAQVEGARRAARTQAEAAQMGVDEQRRQFDAVQALLKPFVDAGTSSLGAQQNLAGLNGAAPQQAAISALQNTPEFKALLQQGENAILANASATGGLRGGNTQGALAQFRPALLAQTIRDQFDRLGQFTTLGQNSAVQQGTAGQNSANSISELLAQQGAARAGGQLASGSRNSMAFGNLLDIGQLFANAGSLGFGGLRSSGPTSAGPVNLEWGAPGTPTAIF